MQDPHLEQQKSITEKLEDSTFESHWQDWKWHIKHSISTISEIEELLEIKMDDDYKEKLSETIKKFPISITPYYLSLIDADDYINDPIFKQSVPSPCELNIDKYDMADPLHEDEDSPAPNITHRYPDRVLFHISNLCSMYCRHCTRKRKVGDPDSIPGRDEIKQGIAYIKNNEGVRDVLLSGGDPLMLSDEYLEWILKELTSIEHVEIIRIGTRMPVVLPCRITDSLVNMIKKYHPVWINTHFNHPREITQTSKQALKKMADAGIPLGNQTVLLAGVNDCPRIMRKLVHKMVQNRVRPYYLYQCDLSEGLTHFRTPVGKGIEIIESLIGHTTGFAVPTYVIDAPGGGGKIPIMPHYLISWSTNKVILRNYEGVITSYKEPDSYESIVCDRNCENCDLHLKLDASTEYRSLGIEKLLNNHDKQISLTPEGNERLERRDD